MKLLWVLALAGVMSAGCTSGGDPAASTTSSDVSTPTTGTTGDADKTAGTTGETTGTTGEEKPASTDPGQDREPNDGEEVAVIETTQGKIVVMFFPDKAPKHVESFKSLVAKKFYDGTRFHRVIPSFMIQGGDPLSKNKDRADDGQGDAGYKVPAEFNDYLHVRGILSAARSNDPDSAGSQFFIMHATSPTLDGQYTIFGRAIAGLDVVDTIVGLHRDQNDNPVDNEASRVKSIRLAKWPVK
jgi:cyclophilin family peptidyl-prolyl cis-trans isomerase